MKTMSIIAKTALTMMCLTSVVGCAGIFDGPFNADGTMVPELLYANNGTDYVTFWDDEMNAYRTYDQKNNAFVSEPLYTVKDARKADPTRSFNGSRNRARSQNYLVAGAVVVPLTHLDRDELAVQAEQGCVACHQ